MKKYGRIKIFVEFLCNQIKDNILHINQYTKSDKMAYIIYVDIESLIKKIDGCASNLEFFNNRNWRAYFSPIFNVSKLGTGSHIK